MPGVLSSFLVSCEPAPRVQVKGSSKVITTSSSCICAHTIVNNLARYSGFGSQHDSAPQSSRNRLLQPVGFSSGIIEPWTGHRQNGVVPSILDRFSKEKWNKSYHSTVQPHRASPKPESSAAHIRVRAEQTGCLKIWSIPKTTSNLRSGEMEETHFC
ncbi:hypothetical protein NXS19_003995 [Fusarium pseudograminearum]|nr:hypothetical protein NXS19_003995 [Fusarium pseudograminearum]